MFNVWSPLERLVSIVWTSINAPVYKNSFLNFPFSVSKMLKEIKHLPSASICLIYLTDYVSATVCYQAQTSPPNGRKCQFVRQIIRQLIRHLISRERREKELKRV